MFYYRENAHLISRKEWEALDLPMDTRVCNGLIMVKIRYDDKNHIVQEFRCTNAGNLSQLGLREHEIARGTTQENLTQMIESGR